ncbi:hypothetical protein FG386_002859 [Cryptosporidium ryanae]|uniref:uncharacterized protein n=1 Tax=Cryptosporidium ryanae TaxID=515981 RepID=UPI00351A791B|nr:hypothetical protein FG386_002859 [Cryptosporidium ryanae]
MGETSHKNPNMTSRLTFGEMNMYMMDNNDRSKIARNSKLKNPMYKLYQIKIVCMRSPKTWSTPMSLINMS